MLGALVLVTGTPELTKESYMERMALSMSILNGAWSESSLGVPGPGQLMKVWLSGTILSVDHPCAIVQRGMTAPN